MTLEDARRSAYAKKCDGLAIDRLTKSAEFEETWGEALESERAIASKLIETLDRLGLQKWFRTQRRRNLAGKTLGELRKMAQRDGVPNYYRLSKDDLISLLGGAA